jgi:copper chaperone CopZ
VREALLSVKGVARAEVTFEGHEAVVTYDPSQATVDDLIRAVDGIEGPIRFRARRKVSR